MPFFDPYKINIMRKIILLLITCTISIYMYAQSPSFGIKGGLNVASIVNSKSSKIAYHAGVFTGIHVSSKWSIQPEVIYSKQGVRQSVSGSNYDINLDYLNIPLLIQFLFKDGLRLEAGPQFGFLLSAKNKSLGVERDIKSNYKPVDISFPIGLSHFWESGFGIYGRWVPGLTEINVTYGSAKNSVFQLGVFYQLSKRNKG
jgi:hypothetical protein